MSDTIFNYIDSVLFNKKKLNRINEGETQFSLYMVNRWCSMYSPDVAEIINETTNKYARSFTLKQDQYEFAYHLLPKCNKKRISYLKKNKENEIDKSHKDDYNHISKNLEISKREVSQYIEFINKINK